MPKHVDWASIRKIGKCHHRITEEFLSIKVVGSSTVRAIPLKAGIIFGTKSSW